MRRHRLALQWSQKHKTLQHLRKSFAWTGEIRHIPPELRDFRALHFFKNPPVRPARRSATPRRLLHPSLVCGRMLEAPLMHHV